MDSEFGVILIGAGHNGLVAANYLALAGLKVAVVEARYIVGGACVSEELIKGAKFSSCAFVQAPSARDRRELALGDFGLEMTAPEFRACDLSRRQPSVPVEGRRPDAAELERISPADAKGFLEFGSGSGASAS
jgi:phytoene dehydrogenase-like protein